MKQKDLALAARPHLHVHIMRTTYVGAHDDDDDDDNTFFSVAHLLHLLHLLLLLLLLLQLLFLPPRDLSPPVKLYHV